MLSSTHPNLPGQVYLFPSFLPDAYISNINIKRHYSAITYINF